MEYRPLPEGPFHVIYADPPWQYREKMMLGSTETGSARKHYPTISTLDLMQLPVREQLAQDALLFLWSTGPMMPDAIQVGKAWGFDYKTVAFVWNKLHSTPGHYTLPQTEFCLVFKHGKIPQPRGVRNVRQLVEMISTKHSRKPWQIREDIESMFPHHRRVELFARDSHPGWTSWGLEVADAQEA